MARTASVLMGRLAAALIVLSALPIVWAWWPARGASPAVSGADGTRPDQILVDLRDDASSTDIQALDTQYGLDLRFNDRYAYEEKLMRATVDSARRDQVLAALRRDAHVEAAEPDSIYEPSWKPNDPMFRKQWNFQLVGAEKAWDEARGKNVVVAVIDTGVAFEQDSKCYRAKDFADTRFVTGYDFINDDAHPNDDNGHGTHVAGTIAETTNNGEGVAGLAPEAKIMPLKVLSREGYGDAADIADAIRFAADHGARVINMSLGSPFPSVVIHNACRYAYKKGCTIVAAAGNSGHDGVSYPAAWPECIAVSAVGPTGDLAPYSSYGKAVAIAAPGGDKSRGEESGILQNTVLPGGESPRDDYYFFQGTSMASPHVAAAAALVISRGVNDPAEVREVLKRSAKPKGEPAKYGAGLLDAAAAVHGAAVARTDVAAKAGLGLLPAVLCLGVAAAMRARGHRRWLGAPLALGIALAFGFLFPDWLTGRVGFDSRLNLLGHSILLPALLLIEVERRTEARLVAAVALGCASHLMWDLARAAAPHMAPLGADTGWVPLPWLWANALVGLGLAIAAFRRGQRAAEE